MTKHPINLGGSRKIGEEGGSRGAVHTKYGNEKQVSQDVDYCPAVK